MKIKYRILWFEDNKSWFETASRNISDFLDDNGFELEATRYDNAHQGIKYILSNCDYDLILMDLNLNGTHGDKIIEDIRNEDLFTEIIFYSQSDVQTIRATIRDKGIDGLYCTSRNTDEFEDKVTKIIRNTIKKVQDVNNMRGLVIAQTIDLENKIKEMLQKYFALESGSTLDDRRMELYNNICVKKKEQIEREKLIIETLTTGNIDSLLESNLLTSNNLYHALQSILKNDLKIINLKLDTVVTSEEKELWESKKLSITSLKEHLNRYDIEIIKLRNTLAHVTEKVNESGVPYLESRHNNGTSIIFDNATYIEIRKNLRSHTENLNSIYYNMFSDASTKEQAAPTIE
ncbi:response regulator [Paenibacillus sp. GYB004]|uniref:response regulator n=1 Tax=Paenibacillus sp. GYB004 TaxID=2994393 RepID=UPI002F966162